MSVFVVVLVVMCLIAGMFNAKDARRKLDAGVQVVAIVEKKCPPHLWSHHPETDKLTCCHCSMEAGVI